MQRGWVHLSAGFLVTAALVGLLPACAHALVLHEGSTDLTVHPDEDTVGRWVTNASCVAVGPDMVLTVRHPGYGVGRSVWFGTTEYVVTDIFAHSEADLRLARVEPVGGGQAGLNAVGLYTTDLDPVWKDETDYTAVIGGYGKARGDDLFAGGVHYGYEWAVGQNTVLRWGENDIQSIRADLASGGFITDIMVASFGPPGGLPAEAAPADYDSGGGWFVNLGTEVDPDWRLAGLTRGVTHLGESWFKQPSGTPPGDNMDAVRVSAYAGWIDAVLHPHEWVTDADGNWSNVANWSTTVPNETERWAVFDDVATGPRTVTIDQMVTIGALRIDAGQSYCFTEGPGDSNWLLFDSDEDVGRIEVNPRNKSAYNAAQRIECKVLLTGPLTVTQGASGDLTLAGEVVGGASAPITKQGDGVLVLAAANTSLSGDFYVEEGALCAAHPDALGTGKVMLQGGQLHLRADADTLFDNRVEAADDGAIHVEPDAGGSGARLALGELRGLGGAVLTITGLTGYSLAVQGQTTFVQTAGDVFALETATADLTFDGPVQLMAGTLRKTGPGRLTFATDDPDDLDFWEETTLLVEDGTVCLHADAGAPDARNLAVHVDGGAVEFASTQHLSDLDLAGGTVACFQDGGLALVTGSLAIEETGGVPEALLDLVDNNLIVDYEPGESPFDAIEAWVAHAWQGGNWDGQGIGSSAARDHPLGITALGVLDNADPNPSLGGNYDLEGETLTTPGEDDFTQVLVKYTYVGDANLDGHVSIADLDLLAYGWENQQGQPGGTEDPRWGIGDSNHDDQVSIADLDLLAYAWENQGAHLPDPATLALLGLGAAGLLARSRRR